MIKLICVAVLAILPGMASAWSLIAEFDDLGNRTDYANPRCQDWIFWRGDGKLKFGCQSWSQGKTWLVWDCPDPTARRDRTTLRVTVTCNAGPCAGKTLIVLPKPVPATWK